jgi:hypothetical protein
MLCLLIGFAATNAKAAEIYRCVQNDGSVVIQDRPCMVTKLQQPKAKNAPKRSLNKIPSSKPINQARRTPETNQTTGKQRSNRSPYFTFGWDRFIPSNWVMQKINTTAFQQLLLSKNQFNSSIDFRDGVKLSVYSDTMRTSGVGAFAQALQLYHQIRDNSSLQLLDSQFKTHPSYKVFNIKYQNQKQHILLTEFYIDEVHNDLFVLTVQANQSQWPLNWQLAEKIIQQL